MLRLAACLLILSLAAWPQPLPLDGISHAGFRVSDLERARAFYTGVLGLPLAFDLKNAEGNTSLAFFQVNGGQYVEISPGLPPDQPVRLTHVALAALDLEAVRGALKARGLDPPPASKGRDGNLAFSVRDPENTRVEFVQYLPGSLHHQARSRHTAAARISAHLQHTGVIVPKERLEAALRFYRDQLGFTETWRLEPSPGDVRLIKLRVPGRRPPAHSDVIELMIHSGALTRERIGSMNHINLAVDDIHAAHRFALTRGYQPDDRTRPRVNAEDIWGMNLFDPDGTRVEVQDLTKIPRAVLREEKVHGRDAYVLDNGWIRVAALRGGGHLAEIRLLAADPKAAINPMRVPHYPTIDPHTYDPARHDASYGDGSHRWLSSGYMGHLLCFPFYGPPSSDDEVRAQLGNHGEAPIVEWRKTRADERADGITLWYSADLPKTMYRVERAVTLPRGLRQFRVEEWVENLAPFDRPFQWMQHATFGPPFVEPGKNFLDASATRGQVAGSRPGTGSLEANSAVDWPRGTGSDNRPADLRAFQPKPAAGAYYALLMDPSRRNQFFTLYHTGFKLLIGYVYPTETNPWLADWQENRSNATPPWNRQVVARGLEFGNSPFAEGLRKAIDRGSLFNVPSYGWIGARQRLKTEFTVFLQEIPEGYGGVRDVRLEHGVPVVVPR